MKYLFLFLVTFSASFLNAQQQELYSRVRIYADSKGLLNLMQLGVGIDHGHSRPDQWFESDFSESDIQIMEENGYEYEVLIKDVQKYYVEQNQQTSQEKNTDCVSASVDIPVPNGFNYGSMAGYLNYDELLAELDEMRAAFPNLISVREPISSFMTFENRPIHYVVISDNPSQTETEPNVLYTALHHAREPMGLSQLIYYMWYLLENYETNAEVKYLVDNNQLFFVPCVNPDGYVYNWTTNPNGGGMHRKNRRDVGTTNKGVDLNRNYSYQWGQQGVSFDPDSDTYCGTGPFSEPETQAMKWLVETFGFKTALNAHTYGDLHLFPIGADAAEFADHHDYYEDLANHMVEHNGFIAQKATSLYPVSGGSDDYMYKENIGVGAKDTVFAMLPEIGPSFWPPQSLILSTCHQMLHPNMVLAHIPHKYLVVRDVDPSAITQTTGVLTHSAMRLGLEDGVVTVSIEPLLNIQSVGSPVVHDLEIREIAQGQISYELVSGIQAGDEVRFVLHTDYGLWIKHDTIIKVYSVSPLQVEDNANVNTNWTGSWNTTTSDFFSASYSFTDSPFGNYANNANTAYTFDQTLDLTNTQTAYVTYYAKWDIQPSYDYVQFQVSVDGGSNWVAQCGRYTESGISGVSGNQPEGEPVYDGNNLGWVMEEIDLSEYIGQQVLLRFILRSDLNTREDGFYFDDFRVYYEGVNGMNEGELSVSVHPNPVDGILKIDVPSVVHDGQLYIVDQFGRIVWTAICEGGMQKTINVSEWESGIYTIHTSVGESVRKPVRFVVLR
jgi:carboxypeptidase T